MSLGLDAGVGSTPVKPDKPINDKEKGELRWMDKDVLHIPSEVYQREPSGKILKRIKEEFNWVNFGVVSVVDRGEHVHATPRYWVIEGGHRVQAAQDRSDVREVPCIVHRINAPKRQALLFCELNSNRKKISSLEWLKAALVFEDPTAIEISNMASSWNREITGKSAPNTFNTVKEARYLLRVHHDAFLRISPLLGELFAGYAISRHTLQAFVKAEVSLNQRHPGQSLARQWKRRVLETGFQRCSQEIDKALTSEGKDRKGRNTKAMLMGLDKALNGGHEDLIDF